jgi:hypothetical protein
MRRNGPSVLVAALAVMLASALSANAMPGVPATGVASQQGVAADSLVVEVQSRRTGRNLAIGAAAGIAAIAIIGAAAEAEERRRAREYDRRYRSYNGPYRGERRTSGNRKSQGSTRKAGHSGSRQPGQGSGQNYCQANWKFCEGAGQNSPRCERYWSSCVGG